MKPLIGITLGDPAGIGPEITLKLLKQKSLYRMCRPVVIGNRSFLEFMAMRLGWNRRDRRILDTIQIVDASPVDLKRWKPGEVAARNGLAAGRFIEEAVRLALNGRIHAIVTCPIQKEAFTKAGFPYPGHTEMLKSLTKSKRVSLMLAVGDFRVVHVTLHTSLKKAIASLNVRSIVDAIRVTHEGLKSMGISRPRIAVAALNPHAGEGGIFGDEETNIITPAVKKAAAKGIRAKGPVSCDAVFSMLRDGLWDAAVCMYHDQGGIPAKLLGFGWDQRGVLRSVRGVNVTLGLNVIRTSVVHGTGFEIAGRNQADPSSLRDAVETAVQMAQIKFARRKL